MAVDQRFLIPFLVAMMLLTGVCNTLLTKYQDLQCVANCDSDDPKQIRRFSQPVIQTLQMFIGEMGCWLVVGLSHLISLFRSRKSSTPLFKYTPLNGHTADDVSSIHSTDENEHLSQSITSLEAHAPLPTPHPPHQTATIQNELEGWRLLLLALPACCDITGTTLMNVGLLYVAASIYQMTRGALVLFVGLFSVLFLRRRLALFQWASLFIVVLGVALVGLAGALSPNPQEKPPPDQLPPIQQPDQQGPSANVGVGGILSRALIAARDGELGTLDAPSAVFITILGVLAIALAQTFTAGQFVLEEYILEHYSLEPIKVVGWEGIFGFTVTALGMLILHFLVGQTDAGRNGYFDAREGLREMFTIPTIAYTSLLIMISIGGFNFFGLSITRSVSATARSIIDTCRTLFIWIVSLGLGWETFKWLQIVGFALLVYGTFLFNGIVRAPRVCAGGRKEGQEGGALMRDETED